MLGKFIAVARQQIFGLLALFVALGGTSYAVATGSIDSREIKNNTIRSKDIRNNQVRSQDVRNGSLLNRDFKAGQLPAGTTGPQGPRGVQGPQGPNADKISFRVRANGLPANTGAFTTVYDPRIGYRIRARCSGTTSQPSLEIDVDGAEDGGVFLASRLGGGPPIAIGPTDGDIDAGQTYVLTPAGGATIANVQVASYSIDFGGRDGETSQARWVGRVMASDPNSPTISQGNCTMAGTSIIAR